MGESQRRSGEVGPSRRELFDAVWTGEQPYRPFIPRLRSDPSPFNPIVRTLDDFRREEGEDREKRLHQVWKRIPHPHHGRSSSSGSRLHTQDERLQATASKWESTEVTSRSGLTRERAERLSNMYHEELLKEVALEDGRDPAAPVTWNDFRSYADYKEAGEQTMYT